MSNSHPAAIDFSAGDRVFWRFQPWGCKTSKLFPAIVTRPGPKLSRIFVLVNSAKKVYRTVQTSRLSARDSTVPEIDG